MLEKSNIDHKLLNLGDLEAFFHARDLTRFCMQNARILRSFVHVCWGYILLDSVTPRSNGLSLLLANRLIGKERTAKLG
jgi:hypothetical protein